MHRTPLTLLAGAALAVLLLAPARPATAAGPMPWPDPWSGYMQPPPWAFRNLPFTPYGPFGGPCSDLGLRWIVRATGYAAGFMDLNPDQQKALAALEDAAKTASGRLKALCDDWDARLPAPERMKRLGEALDAARDEMKTVRPRFEDFYRTLTPRQKQIIDDTVSGRGPGFGRWWEDY